jgi:DNA mismatch endonuclease, patch repair protein
LGFGHPLLNAASARPGMTAFCDRLGSAAIFCDSSFWDGRGWPEPAKKIKRNKGFWRKKIEGTIRRDADVNRQVDEAGWRVLRFWDNDILRCTDECVP